MRSVADECLLVSMPCFLVGKLSQSQQNVRNKHLQPYLGSGGGRACFSRRPPRGLHVILLARFCPLVLVNFVGNETHTTFGVNSSSKSGKRHQHYFDGILLADKPTDKTYLGSSKCI